MVIGILERYKLSYHFDKTASQPSNNESDFSTQDQVFRDTSKIVDKYLLHDKRLNQLWDQAKQSGFTSDIINFYHRIINILKFNINLIYRY